MPTPPTTDNHDLPLIPPVGDANAPDYEDIWGSILNDDAWSEIDTKLVARDTAGNRSNYTAYQDALFRATDTGALYTGDGSSWTLADGVFDGLSTSTLSVSTAPTADTDVVRKTELDTLNSNTLDSSEYTPETDTHSRYTDSEAISAVDGEVSAAASSLSALDSQVSTNVSDISSLQSNKLDSSAYTPESDTHSRYTDSEAVSAVEATSTLSLSGGLTVSGDVTNGTTTIWDNSAGSVPNAALANDTVTVAGRSVSLGGSTNIGHSDLTNIAEDQHHSKSHDHTEADITAVPNAGLSNSTVTVAGNTVSLGGNTSLAHSDLGGIGANDHHSKDHDHSEQGISTVGNQGLTNYQVTVAGNTVALGASTAIAHSDLGSIGTDDHHVAHEHPGDRAAQSNVDLGSNGLVSVSTISGQYATHNFDGSSYNIDLEDSNTDARYRSTNNNTIIWFREAGDVEVPNGQLSEGGNRVATRTWASSTFETFGGFSWSEDTNGDLVLSDGSVDLIRQPKGGSTQFVQGADIGPIEAPADSLTQLINAPNKNANSGATVGYNFALDNSSVLSIRGISDGSGGMTTANVEISGDLRSSSGTTIWDSSLGSISSSVLDNNNVTISGQTVALGNSISLSPSDIGAASDNHGDSEHEYTLQIDGQTIGANDTINFQTN